jgi:hypothetical protein
LWGEKEILMHMLEEGGGGRRLKASKGNLAWGCWTIEGGRCWAAKEVCGEDERRIENPWMVGKEEDIQRMKSAITWAVTNRNEVSERESIQGQGLQREMDEARERLRDARRVMKRELRRWEREWWEEKINQCLEAEGRGDSGKMYKIMRELGKRGWKGRADTTTITKEEFREHFKSVSEHRFENTPEEIEEALNEIEDISNTEEAINWADMLEATPEREEILTEIKKMRDHDGLRLIGLTKGGEVVEERLIELVLFMFNNGADA